MVSRSSKATAAARRRTIHCNGAFASASCSPSPADQRGASRRAITRGSSSATVTCCARAADAAEGSNYMLAEVWRPGVLRKAVVPARRQTKAQTRAGPRLPGRRRRPGRAKRPASSPATTGRFLGATGWRAAQARWSTSRAARSGRTGHWRFTIGQRRDAQAWLRPSRCTRCRPCEHEHGRHRPRAALADRVSRRPDAPSATPRRGTARTARPQSGDRRADGIGFRPSLEHPAWGGAGKRRALRR